MTSKELRQKFLDFFKKHGHTIVPSSSLLPTDPSVFFTTAGMQQFKPYYLGEESPYGKNVASCQKCIRTSDIEEVGDESHLTFFEMLGNFSFGGYFKEEAIKLAYKFIVEELKLEIDYVTFFSPDKVDRGDWRKGVPEDEDSYKIWVEMGVPEKKIKKEGIDNFWGPTGEEGPCGPTTEIYVNGIEIWNIVFNEYYYSNVLKNNGIGNLRKLEKSGIDTGMGLERLAMVMQKVPTVFEIDTFKPIIEKIGELSGKKDEENKKEFRIIADHIKASVFLVAEGIAPSNLERGYILRRLLRRAIRYGKLLKMPDGFLSDLIKIVVEIYKDTYPEVWNKEEEAIFIVRQEKEKFEKTLENGLREFEKLSNVSGKDAFNLYQTYGFPIEMTQELAKEKGINVDIEEFKKELVKHQDLSRTASAGMFKGGLADASEATTKLHTAAHLMLAGLRNVLGEHAAQKGSNINSERLRFDFTHKEKMTKDQIKDVENFVNGIIEKDLPVWFEEMTLEKAKEINAMGIFESKYGQIVKVYFVGKGDENASKEICGGPHVDKTGGIGHFKIVKEESSSSGVRRIKAILE